MEPTDFEIIQGIRNKNDLAVRQLNGKYFPILCRYGQFVLGLDAADAAELANETLLKAITSNNGFRANPGRSLKPWLLTILRNLNTDKWRKDKCDKAGAEIMSFDESEGGDDGDNNPTADEVSKMLHSEFRSHGTREDPRVDVIAQAMSKFKPEEQEILWAYIGGMTHFEISSFRKSSKEATRKHVNRLWHKLVTEISTITGTPEKVINGGWKRQNSKGSPAVHSERKAGGS